MLKNATYAAQIVVTAGLIYACIGHADGFAQATAEKVSTKNLSAETTTTVTHSEHSIVPATTRRVAEETNSVKTGRADPLLPIDGAPSHGFFSRKKKNQPNILGTVPPPPGALGNERLLPPPPPTSEGALALSELPIPPSRPSIVPKLKLSAILDDHAVFVISDLHARRAHKWPGVISLSEGEQFGAVKVTSIGDDSVTLDEDGIRSVKELEPLR